ncbi:HesA/MoeB/ThiF family protein [Hydrogenimonas sp. SS33]|uniref:HesA/MoeB/ThiF family protein n=1 Tax=Hydrogenimonas leucolamina TaxID=2954236 RepID=UPI00336BDDCD
MENYYHYFNRQVMLWGEETQASLQRKKIAIVGSGGLGSSLVIALGASGVGAIDLIDFDEVSTHNIHRQIAFTVGDEGKFKAEVAAELAMRRCPFVKVTPHVMPFETFAGEERRYDLILDATDNLPSRAQIDAYAKRIGCPWVYGSVEAFNGQVCFIDKSSFDAFRIMEREPAGIAAPIVMHIASLQANLALRYLAGESVKKDLLYYLYFNDEGELVTQKFKMPV